MEEGEKYLTISLFGGQITIPVYPNKKREENKQAPHFVGNGAAVWVNKKKSTIKEEEII